MAFSPAGSLGGATIPTMHTLAMVASQDRHFFLAHGLAMPQSGILLYMSSEAAPGVPPPRYEVDAYVDYTGRSHQMAHRVENISLGGVCVHVPKVEPPGKRVSLRITFPELSASIEAVGEVIWSRDDTRDMGIRFLDMDPDRVALLQRYLHAIGRERPPSQAP